MNLYLVRHGIAVDPGGQPDGERVLTGPGIKKTRKLARYLRGLGLCPDLILTSPYLRARQTADLLAEGLGVKADQVVESEFLLPGGDPTKLLERLHAKEAMLVGHEPDLSELASVLLTGAPGLDITLKKGGVCCLSIEKLSDNRCAALEWLLQPKLLVETNEALPSS